VGGLGLILDLERMARPALCREGDLLLLIGAAPDDGWLGQSLYLRELFGREDGAPPPVDLLAERRAGLLIRSLIREGRVSACHDVADGGLAVAVAEMAMAGGLGARLLLDATTIGTASEHGWLFGEDQGRYVVSAMPEEAPRILADAPLALTTARVIGTVGGAELKLGDHRAISVRELFDGHETWLPAYMSN
jgi:phosphoribosylformylglycinamidine synthase